MQGYGGMGAMGRVKLFFWSSILGGIVMSYNAFNFPTKPIDFAETKQGDLNSLQQVMDYRQEPEETIVPKKTVNKRSMSITISNEKRTHFDKGRLFEVNGVDHVFLRGKYRPYNPENIYYVDGEKIYFSMGKPLRKVEREEVIIKKRIKPTQAGKISLNPIKAYAPENVENMVITLKQARKNIKIRNGVLKDLAKESDAPKKKNIKN